jgi:hypothetical protein
MTATLLLAGLALGAPAATTAQDGGEHRHAPEDAPPYADLLAVEGTSMTAEQLAELRAGSGMQLALPAELNSYPGPLHVLELADQLDISDAARAEVEAIRAAMLEAAIVEGEAVIEADRALASAFRAGAREGGPSPTPEEVARLTAELARKRGELQAIHLDAHLKTRALLTDEQIATYDRLRGYGGDVSPGAPGREHTPPPPDRR